MAGRVTPRRRGSYGIDAPFAPAFLAALVILYLVLAWSAKICNNGTTEL